MAINSTDYINAGKPKMGGAIHAAPYGTALPKNSIDKLNEVFACVGFITEDGVSNNISRSATNVKAWGGDTVLRVQTDFGDEFSWGMLQANDIDVLNTTFGADNVSGTLSEGMVLKVNSSEVPQQSFVLDMVLKDGGTKRIVIPNGSLTMSGEVIYADSDAVSYPVTVAALPDSDGNTHYEYTKSAVAEPMGTDKNNGIPVTE